MFTGKNILIVGAGNAGRPVANLLKYLKNNVMVTDSNPFDKLPKKAQKKIAILEKRGTTFELGNHDFDILKSIDAVYISPNIPKTAEFIKKIHDLAEIGELAIIENKDIGNILNSLIAIPMIGIAGTDGKTTTTNMINFALKDNFNTLIFSSLQDSLVIEGLVEMIVNSFYENKDLAIFELPHGTIRMAEGLELDLAVVTNLSPDHMDEFNSYLEYIDRNIAIEELLKKNGLALVNGDDPIISSRLNTFTHDFIVYGLKNPQTIEFEGNTYYNDKVDYDIIATDIKLNGLNGSSYKIKSNKISTLVCTNCNQTDCNCGNYKRKIIEPFECEVNIKVPGMINVENSLVTILGSLVLGLDLEESLKRIATFKGLKGRFEKIDSIDDINIFMDAAHNPESMEKLFNGLDINGRLILSLDNPDTLTSRDKNKIGEILSDVVDVLIVSSKNETTEIIDPSAAFEVLEGANKQNEIESYITNNVYESISYALAIADTGDTVLHIGPGVVNAYDNVKNDIKGAISFYKAISGKVVVIGGCGTVGSLIARVLKSNNVDVTISDSNSNTPLKKVFEQENIELDLGSHNNFSNMNTNKLLANASSFFLAPSLMNNKEVINNLNVINPHAPILGVSEILKYFKANKAVFGITGTNGKTTTTEILKNIFKAAGLKVPEHYLDIQGNTEFIPILQSKLDGDVGVIEIGTFGNKGEIKNISKNAEVETGIITNISPDHLNHIENSNEDSTNDFNMNVSDSNNNNNNNYNNFNKSSFDNYISCKKEIIDVADNLILCGDDPLVTYLGSSKDEEDLLFFGINDFDISNNINNNKFNSNTYSKNDSINNDLKNASNFNEFNNCPKCGSDLKYDCSYLGHLGKYKCSCGFKNPTLDVEARDIHFDKNTGLMKHNLKVYENQGEVILQNPGIANVYNSLAAATGAWLSGIDFKDILKGINSFKGVDGRLEIINENPKIILDYAHNPAGVESVIQTVFTIMNNENTNSNNRLIIVNTISSESGNEGDLEIAKLLSNADIIIPVSNTAYNNSKYIDTINCICEIKNIESSKEGNKVGTLGASYNQVKEGIELAIKITNLKTDSLISSSQNDSYLNSNDIILIIGEGGLKYSKKILSEENLNI